MFSYIDCHNHIEPIYNQVATISSTIDLSSLPQEPILSHVKKTRQFKSAPKHKQLSTDTQEPLLEVLDYNQPTIYTTINTIAKKYQNMFSSITRHFVHFKKQGLTIGGSTVIPPDTQGAVGISHIVMTLNDRIVIQKKLMVQQIYQLGKSVYTLDFGQGEIRWGDYSNTVVDPVNNTDMWTIQEYAENFVNGTSKWGVACAKFTPPTH